MEYLYKLNFPAFDEIATDEFRHYVVQNLGKEIFKEYYSQDFVGNVIKEKYSIMNGIEFNYGVLFIKPAGHVMKIHYDGMSDQQCWGIHYNPYGNGTVNFYNENLLGPHSLYDNGRAVKFDNLYSTDIKPEKSYSITPGVYLFNARKPHGVVTITDRVALSIRNHKLFDGANWENVIENFSSYII